MLLKFESEDSLLIVDDVYDTGLSVQQTIKDIKTACENTPELELHLYFKPNSNQTDNTPIIISMRQMIGLCSRIAGLTKQEIADNKPQLSSLIDKIGDLIT